MGRAMLVLTLAMLIFAGGGAAMASLAGWNGPWPPLLGAAGVVWIAGLAGAAPLWFARGAPQASVAQAGLAGTMIHLMLCTVAAAVVSLGNVGPQTPFLYWLMAFYWLTLIVLVVVFVRAVKAAPLGSATGR